MRGINAERDWHQCLLSSENLLSVKRICSLQTTMPVQWDDAEIYLHTKLFTMKKIIVATDFSPAAMNAANYAADMATSINAAILLLHTYQVPVTYSEVPVAVNLDEIQKNTENKLKLISDELKSRTGNKITVDITVKVGSFYPELKVLCETEHPYAVIMGSQGTTAAERLFFGGHAVYAMKHLPWPLITVPSNAAFTSIKKIGLACDFNKVVETTPVDQIKNMVNDFHAELHVLNTGKEGVYDPDIVFESGMLQELLASMKPAYHLLTHENIDEGIMDFAEKNHLDLLVVLPKRHNLLDSIIHRSHTRQLVLHSHVPVMALHQS